MSRACTRFILHGYVLLYCGIVYFACREYVCVYACTCAQVHISVLYKVFMNCCLVTSLVKYWAYRRATYTHKLVLHGGSRIIRQCRLNHQKWTEHSTYEAYQASTQPTATSLNIGAFHSCRGAEILRAILDLVRTDAERGRGAIEHADLCDGWSGRWHPLIIYALGGRPQELWDSQGQTWQTLNDNVIFKRSTEGDRKKASQ